MASSSAIPADFTSARGSNAGDQFHELWALRQILQLMKPTNAGLTGVTVEGIGDDTPPIDEGGEPHRWEGVDCALFYGGATMEDARRVELVQLKYSSANPRGKWTVARLCENTKKAGNNSVIRRLADDFTKAKARARDGADVVSRLVSNQEIADHLESALRLDAAPADWPAEMLAKHNADRAALRRASGLSLKAFQAFLHAFDTSGCGPQSRHAVGLDVVEALASVLGDDVLTEVSQLRTRVRDLMLPEGFRTVTDRNSLLSWFGVYGWEGLFPAPASLTLPTHPIARKAAQDVALHFLSGERYVLLHGEGGSGKTTLSQQVVALLPKGSIQVAFDCFGGGSYMYSTDKRHRPEKAFLQLANDVAVASDCPVFVPRSGTHLASIETFADRLAMAAKTLERVAPDAFLLVIVDAADNSVTAAQNSQPKERPFVWDLAELDIRALPPNVRFLVSSRTSRLASLEFPGNVKKVHCDAFTRAESAEHLFRSFPEATDDQVGQFHFLTGGNPRVQAYALSVAGANLATLFTNLLPNGRTLPDVLEALFQEALQKLGQPQVFEKLTAALAVLPAPASIEAIAAVAEVGPAIVRDFALDLKKGLLITGETLTIADEDFEKYVADRSSEHQREAVTGAAQYFWEVHKTDVYAASHVVDFLIRAGRQKDVFSVLDGDPSVAAVKDPALTREIQNARLSFALASCRQSGDLTQELKTILLGATARHDEGAFFDVIDKEIDLSCEFSKATIFRRILIDRDRTADQGSALAHFALGAARKGDRTETIQYLNQYDSWIQARQNAGKTDARHKWKLTDEDAAALTEATFRVLGAEEAYRQLNRWRPLRLRLRIAQIIAPRLIIGGTTDQLLAALKDGFLRAPFDLTVAVPLEQSGLDVPREVWLRSFKALRRAHLPPTDHRLDGASRRTAMAWQACLLTACEIAVHKKLPKGLMHPILNLLERALIKDDKAPIALNNANRVDATARVWLLKRTLDKKDPSAKAFLKFIESVKDRRPERLRPKKRQHRTGRQDDDKRRDHARFTTIHSVYSARLALMGDIATSTNDAATTISSYDFDSGYESVAMRHAMATSFASLTFLPKVTPADLRTRASGMLDRRYEPDDELAPDLAVLAPLALREVFHGRLIELINDAANKVAASTSRATEKVSILVGYSRFLLPISPRDAASLFNRALTLAKDIDDEAVDQIGFVSSISPIACPDATHPDSVNAHRLATFAAGASLRLYGSDVFDWGTVVSGLTTLDPATSLASLARWSDEGMAHLETTISSFSRVALRRKVISPALALGLAQTGAGLTDDLIGIAVPAIQTVDAGSRSALYEEIARIILTEHDQHSRRESGEEFLRLIGELNPGPMTDTLRKTMRFVAGLSRVIAPRDVDDGTTLRSSSTEPSKASTLQRFVPNVTNLADVVRGVRAEDAYAMAGPILSELSAKHVLPRDRIDFLNAVVRLDREVATAHDWGRVLNDLLVEWASPAVNDWARAEVPGIIRENLAALSRWLPYKESSLDLLLERSGISIDEQIDALLAGIAESGTAMESKVLFALAERIVVALSASQASNVLDWYLHRLEDRIPSDDRAVLAPQDTPANIQIAVGRYFFALFGDIDTRVRWSAGHAVRLLARTGEGELVAEIYRNFERLREDGFRAPSAPFYWLAARLWASMVAYRVAYEAPDTLHSSIEILTKAAIGSELPHVAIRESAKRAVLELASRGFGSLSDDVLMRVQSANTPSRILKRTSQYQPSPRFDRTRERASRRFDFDEMDTIPYWYNGLLHVFPRVGQERILELAENWIIDQWGASSDERRRTSEARKGRLREGHYSMTTHGHGSLPTVEDYGTHLEWHAMLAVAGELLETEAVGAYDDAGRGRFEEWLEGFLPTNAPYWLADLRGPTPLEAPFWTPDSKKDPQWLRPSSVPDTLVRAGILRDDEWVVVGSRTEYRSRGRLEEVTVDSALVGEIAADALVRSLQTSEHRYDIYLPSTSDESIRWGVYHLEGWLARIGGDTKLDEKDARRYDVKREEMRPGRQVSSDLALQSSPATSPIEYPSEGKEAFRYEAWDDEPPQESDRHNPGSASSGWRLLVSKATLGRYLEQVQMSLVAKIVVERRTHKSYSSPYAEGSRKKEFWKTITLTSAGKIRDGVRDIGTWKAPDRRVRRRGKS